VFGKDFDLFSFFKSKEGSKILDSFSKNFGGNGLVDKITSWLKGLFGHSDSSTVEDKQNNSADPPDHTEQPAIAVDDQSLFNDLKTNLSEIFSGISDQNLIERIRDVSNGLSAMVAPEGLTQTFDSVTSGKLIMDAPDLLSYTQELISDGTLSSLEAGMLNDAVQGLQFDVPSQG
jgi:hypothetical protein